MDNKRKSAKKVKLLPNEKEYKYWRDRLGVIVEQLGVDSLFENSDVFIAVGDICDFRVKFRGNTVLEGSSNDGYLPTYCNTVHGVKYIARGIKAGDPSYAITDKTSLSPTLGEYIDTLYAIASKKKKLDESIEKLEEAIKVAKEKKGELDLEVELSLFGGHKEPVNKIDTVGIAVEEGINKHEANSHPEIKKKKEDNKYKAEYIRDHNDGRISITTDYCCGDTSEVHTNPSKFRMLLRIFNLRPEIKTMEIIYK